MQVMAAPALLLLRGRPPLSLFPFIASSSPPPTHNAATASTTTPAPARQTRRRRRSSSSSRRIVSRAGAWGSSSNINDDDVANAWKRADKCTGFIVASSVEGEAGPLWLRCAVATATECLRIIKPDGALSSSTIPVDNSSKHTILGIQEVVAVLEDDYRRSYFLTGNFSNDLYAENCLFADPTIRFSGKDLYRRNLKLLVPFYEEPSLSLLSIKEENANGTWKIKAFWKLSTYLKFPWRPLVFVDGCTIYNLDASLKIVRHVESWNVSAFEAILQLFVPSERASWNKQ